MKNWRRVFLGTLSSALIVLPTLSVSAESGQSMNEPGNMQQRPDTRQGQGATMGREGKSDSMKKGKSATGEPAAGGPQGEDKAGGSGPSGPEALPPGKAPQFEGGKKTK